MNGHLSFFGLWRFGLLSIFLGLIILSIFIFFNAFSNIWFRIIYKISQKLRNLWSLYLSIWFVFELNTIRKSNMNRLGGFGFLWLGIFVLIIFSTSFNTPLLFFSFQLIYFILKLLIEKCSYQWLNQSGKLFNIAGCFAKARDWNTSLNVATLLHNFIIKIAIFIFI